MAFVDSTLNPNQQAAATVVLLPATFVAGMFALIALIGAALVAIVFCVSLCETDIVELSTHMSTLSVQTDPMVKHLMLMLIAYGVVKLLHLGRR